MTPDDIPPVTDLLKTTHEFKYKDKTYLLRKTVQKEQAQFSEWLCQRARESAGRSVDLPEEIQDKLLAGLNAQIASGEFEFGSQSYHLAAVRPFGLAKFLQLQLQPTNPEVTYEYALEIVTENFKEIMAKVLGEAKQSKKVEEALGILFGESSASFTSAPRANRTQRRGKKSRR